MPEKSKSMPGVRLQIRLAKRKQAVAAVEGGESATDVARIMGVPIRTLFFWLSAYRHGGHHALEEAKRSGRPRKLSAEVMKWLYDIVTQGDPRQIQLPFGLWTLGIIRTALKTHHQIELSKAGVSRLMNRIGLSPQKPIYKSYKRDPEALKNYLDITYPGLRKHADKIGAQIYFVDESCVRSDAHRGTTWGVIGQTPTVTDTGDRFSIKLISAVSPRGDMKFACFEGYMNGARFVKFIKDLRSDAGCPIIVIADNASYHRSQEVGELQDEACDIIIAHLPTYSPELNPDEQVWNHAKGRLAKLYLGSKADFKTALLKIMRSIQSNRKLICSFFQLKDTKYAACA